jgi:uncharacterized membrane protein YjgN (DUF898 family)
MNDIVGDAAQNTPPVANNATADASAPAPSALTFHGTWQEFAAIAFPNLLLTIVTLGIYRFWATTREREYLWSQTEFIDERLEWAGRGMELFIGFLMVLLLIALPFAFLQFGYIALQSRGYVAIAGILYALSLLLIFYLGGVAQFRALRYRLSRTYWRGIRGGSEDNGLVFGFSYIWKTIAGYIPLFLMIPWSMTSLWNERWNKMSFGPYQFSSNADWTPLMKRYLLAYLIPFIIVIGAVIVGFSIGISTENGEQPSGAAIGSAIALGVFAVLAFYVLLPLAALAFYSKFYREAVGKLRLGDLEFEFKARTPDWLLFGLASIAITYLTFGIGIIFLSYIRWKFFVKHLEVYGEVNLDRLTQSDTDLSKHGEGLLDALDVGAF